MLTPQDGKNLNGVREALLNAVQELQMCLGDIAREGNARAVLDLADIEIVIEWTAQLIGAYVDACPPF